MIQKKQMYLQNYFTERTEPVFLNKLNQNELSKSPIDEIDHIGFLSR